MQFRPFGQMDWRASVLGFGCMRLPLLDNRQIDEEKAAKIIYTAIDHGVNYLDTAYVYHDGQSEVFLGKILRGGYREKVKVADKLPIWEVKKPEDFERILDEQLARMQTEHIDLYLFHSLDGDTWQNTVLRHDLIPRAEKALRDGKIGHIGFSFHDDYAAFETILDGYDRWEFCQIQYNYMDAEDQAGQKGLRKASARGLAVVIMEPLLGGRLAAPPQDVTAIFAEADPNRTPAEWALQWLWSQPEVSVVLSGMSTMEQVQENLESAGRSRAGLLGGDAAFVFDNVREKYRSRKAVPCTGCRYCMPCPNGVDIPGIFGYYNDGLIYDQAGVARFRYNNWLPEGTRADHCIQCRICEEKCPQSIGISEWMPKIHDALGEK